MFLVFWMLWSVAMGWSGSLVRGLYVPEFHVRWSVASVRWFFCCGDFEKEVFLLVCGGLFLSSVCVILVL